MTCPLSCQVSRRRFVQTTGLAAAAAGIAPAAETEPRQPHAAQFYEVLNENKIQCLLCPSQCKVEPGKRGECGVRENQAGRYVTLNYGRPAAINNDPIEKKPFFHVYPRSRAFSIATVGCNIHCKFCQNWELSQSKPEDVRAPYVPPEQIAMAAKRAGCKTIAYTYSEPTIFYEYALDCAKAGNDIGIESVVVSNGYISRAPLEKMIPHLTAMKVDLKAFSQQFYGKICGGRLQPVLESLKLLASSNVWLEIVVLLIPTLNDDMDEIKRMAAWIVKSLGPDVPLHFTRFHPMYKIKNLPPTPPRTLEKARKTAMAQGCHYVYGGNLPGILGENTYCPKCKTMIIDRHGHSLLSNTLKAGKCHRCETAIPGVWEK